MVAHMVAGHGHIRNAIVPTGTVFLAILELRNPARAFIAENCREPDLDEAVGDSIESSSS